MLIFNSLQQGWVHQSCTNNKKLLLLSEDTQTGAVLTAQETLPLKSEPQRLPSCSKLCLNKTTHQSAPLCPRSAPASALRSSEPVVTVLLVHHLAHLTCQIRHRTAGCPASTQRRDGGAERSALKTRCWGMKTSFLSVMNSLTAQAFPPRKGFFTKTSAKNVCPFLLFTMGEVLMKALALPIRAAVPDLSAKQPSVVLQQLMTSMQQSSGPHSSPRVHTALWLLTHKWVLAQTQSGHPTLLLIPKACLKLGCKEEMLTSAASPPGDWK